MTFWLGMAEVGNHLPVSMHDRRLHLLAIFIALLLLPIQVSGEGEEHSIATLDEIGSIEELALGISEAELRPQGDLLLLVGDDGYAHLIDSSNPEDRSKDISLTSGKQEDLNALSWHPGGQSALIVGENGMVLRFMMDNYALETVDGRGILEGEKQNSIKWNRNGDTAYLGGDNGSIYSYSSAEGFNKLTQTNSPVTGLECHPSPETRICMLTTTGDGVAVIDSYNEVHWISNTNSDTWVDVICPDVARKTCILVGSGKRITMLNLNAEDPKSSTTSNAQVLTSLNGELTGASLMGDGNVALHVAPYSLAAYNLAKEIAWSVVTAADVEDLGSIRGSSMVHIWGTQDDTGFIISSSGALAEMKPLLEEEEEDDLMTIAVVTLVAISVPGVFLGMLYMNSSTMQRWWHNMTTKRRKRKELKNNSEK